MKRLVSDPSSLNHNESSDATQEPSVSPQQVIDLFKSALKQPDWINDVVADQFPRTRRKNGLGVPPLGSDNPVQGRKRRSSRSLAASLELQAVKRPKPSGSGLSK